MKEKMNSLILVNREHACPEDLAQDLVPVCGAYPHVLMERQAARALSRMMEQLDGWRFIVPVSGWRSMEEQRTLYEQSLR